MLCALGLPAGFVLFCKVPLCKASSAPAAPAVSIIVPARNEEHNLPQLLGSLQQPSYSRHEILIVDDASTDRTAAVAQSSGARVISAVQLPSGWTGKTSACSQGAGAARESNLLFLDADTWLEPDGLDRLLACLPANHAAAVSVLPYHVMRRPYEQLSLFFNLLMAIGAGGFGFVGKPHLFGQSLLISKPLYQRTGGHAAVRGHILENLALSSLVREARAQCLCFCGRGTLNVRMFPRGIASLCEGWSKAFADGAAASGAAVLAISSFWLTALCSTFLLLFLSPAPWRVPFAVVYLCLAAQILLLARRIGSYSAIACLLYPLPLLFYFGIFGQSLYRRTLKRKVTWRGRQI